MSTRHPIADSPDALPTRVDVIVVGAGPVGAAFALDLARRGVDVLAIDPDGRLAFDGRARTLSAGAVEHLRSWGVVERMHEASPIPAEWHRGTSYRTSIAGRELWRTEPSATERELSAERPHRLPQNRTAGILRAAAVEAGAVLGIGWRAVGFAQDGDGVTVDVQHADGRTSTVHASYAVAADGSRSEVRRAAGIHREATPFGGHQYSVIVEVPGVFEATGTTPNAYNWIFGDTLSDAFNPFEIDRYGLSIGPFPEEVELSEERISAEVARRVGIPLPHTTVSITSYRLQKRIATTFRAGRLLVAGDAAHAFPPSLGMNLNTGIADVGNGAWKLAAVVQGWAGDGLLDSYDQERRLAAHRVGDATLEARDALDRRISFLTGHTIPEGDTDADRSERDEIVRVLQTIVPPSPGSVGASLDQRADHASVVVPDGTPAPAWTAGAYVPLWRPGHRVPHLPLVDGTALHHRFGAGFTLVVDTDAAASAAAEFASVAADRGIPFDVLSLGPLRPARSTPTQPLPARAFSLVRPDRTLAWHGDRLPDDPAALLRRVTGHSAALPESDPEPALPAHALA